MSHFLHGGNNSSSSSSVIVTTFNVVDSPATWTPNAKTQYVRVFGIAGGGGGGSGGKNTTDTAVGGAGSTAGGTFVTEGPISIFGASQPVTIGTGGAGAVSVTVNSRLGLNGASGGNTTFGALVATGGNQGNAFGISLFNNYTSSIGGTRGSPGTGPTAGAGWSYDNNPTATGFFYPGGGGGGGAFGQDGAVGGALIIDVSGNFIVQPGLGGVGVGSNGGNGNPMPSNGMMSVGTGGGGGAGGDDTGTNGGTGGNGAFPGAAGGGGGCGINDSSNSGPGGHGADGIVIVIEFL